jgi:hypothetical protein
VGPSRRVLAARESSVQLGGVGVQRIHLRPRLSNPTSMPATIAISAATMGLCSIVVSRSVHALATRTCALPAVSEIFCCALSTASKTVFVLAAECVRVNSDSDVVEPSGRAARKMRRGRSAAPRFPGRDLQRPHRRGNGRSAHHHRWRGPRPGKAEAGKRHAPACRRGAQASPAARIATTVPNRIVIGRAQRHRGTAPSR